ncbi:MAG TPA: hypothetical protein VLC09_20180 [Polyangiaceae bacterium]|nr:hypothetical protein [Polyangiaceae bacterium]
MLDSSVLWRLRPLLVAAALSGAPGCGQQQSPSDQTGAKQETSPSQNPGGAAAPPAAPSVSAAAAVPSAAPSGSPSNALAAPAAAEATSPLPKAPAELPEGIVPHQAGDVPVPYDKALRVTHAAAGVRHAILYLQGMCSDARSADGWVDLASRRGTVIAVRPDVTCEPERRGYKWPAEPGAIEARIERALEFVREQRGGQLDLEVVTLVGYSQGSGRAELLASRNPHRYSQIILGGHPSPVFVPNFQRDQRVAMLGGELEKTEDMRASVVGLGRAGVASRFFLLPGAHHGSYGPEQRRILPEVFDWLGVDVVSAPSAPPDGSAND